MSEIQFAPGLTEKQKDKLRRIHQQAKDLADEPDSGEPENTLKAKAQSQFEVNNATLLRTAEKEAWLASLNAKKGFKNPW